MLTLDDAVLTKCVTLLGNAKGVAFYKMGLGVPADYRDEWFDRMFLAVEQKSIEPIKPMAIYKYAPVPIKEFVESPYYLDKAGTVYPIILDELMEMNSGKYVEVVLTGGIGCLSYDTEYLSPTGWKPISEYDGGQVGEYSKETKTVSFNVPKSFVKLPCTDFWHFKTKYSGANMMLSDEHRVLWENRKTGKQSVSLAKNIAETHNKGVQGFEGQIPSTFKIEKEGALPLTENQLRLMVAVIADGTFRKNEHQPLGRYLCQVFLKKERKKLRLRSLLTLANIDWRENSTIQGREGFTRFSFTAPLRKKIFDEYFWGSSKEQLAILVDEVFHWDGSIRDTDRSPKNKRFCTIEKQSADFIQYALACCGVRSGILKEDNSRGLGNSDKPLYTVGTVNKSTFGIAGTPKTPIKKVAYGDGYKYCFETSTGFFIARYKGCIFATGNSGKTTAALYSTAYQVYLLSCMKDPHGSFGLDKSSEILMIFQSLNASLAKALDYTRFKSMIDGSPYFKEHFMYNKDVQSKLIFPNRIEVVPVSGLETAAIGQNVIGGVLDELNYMAVTAASKHSIDGGTFDQAVALYNSIARRRKSRFQSAGALPGLLCLVSSKRYPGQFTDLKEAEAVRDKTIYIYDKRVWDVKPAGSFSGGFFDVFIGDEGRKPRVLRSDEHVDPKDRHLVDHIPMEFKEDFDKDITNALREIAGKSTLARHPFIMNTEAITKCMDRNDSIFSLDVVDFVNDQLHILPDNFFRTELPRYAHIDLGLTGDSAGLTIGTVTGFNRVLRNDTESGEMLPSYHIDGCLEVRPPKGGEILFWKIRNVLYKLREMGLNIRWVSLDTFQSKDTMQILKQKGFFTGTLSMDVSSLPYEITKTALYDGRISMPRHDKLRRELASLEMDARKGKIDHPATAGGSKDCSDSLAGCVSGLISRREVWGHFGIPPTEIPEQVKRVARDSKDTEKVGANNATADNSETRF